MLSLEEYKLIAGILILLTSMIAVIYPLKIRAHPSHHPLLELADAFASGIFLGAALFHMLPEAILVLQQNHSYPLAEFLCAGGFLILLFLERLSSHTHSSAASIPYVFALILIIHALIEGTVLGINTTFAATAIIFLAIIAHKSSESFALAVILNRNALSLKKIFYIVTLFSFMTPLGIILGIQLTDTVQWETGKLLTASFNAFAAGTFLYMSTIHHINHHERQHESEGLWEFGALVIGLLMMAALAAL